MDKNLPARPSLEHFRGQAKRLLAALAAGDDQAAQAFIQHLPAAKASKPVALRKAAFRLTDAQSVIARKHGFPSWASLTRHVTELRALEGDWRFTRLEVDGTAVDQKAFEHARILFDGDRFRTEAPEGSYEGIFTIDADAKPKSIDIRFIAGPEAGNICFGIYDVQSADSMTLCLGLVGSPRPRAFESSPGSGHALEQLQRVSSTRPENVDGGNSPEPVPAGTKVKASEAAAFDAPLTSELKRLQGEWAAVELVMNGKPAPAEWLTLGSRVMVGNELKVVFGGQTMVHARVRIDCTTKPWAVDYLNLSGKHQGTITFGLMEWAGDEVVFLMAPAAAPRPARMDEKMGTRTRWRKR